MQLKKNVANIVNPSSTFAIKTLVSESLVANDDEDG
jgi:hypothetical protein